MLLRNHPIVPALALLVSASTQLAFAGSKIYVGTQDAPGPRISMDQIDHSVWDTILKEYVRTIKNER